MQHLLSVFTQFVEQYGPIAIFVSAYFETFGLPFPGESGLLATSALAAKGDVNIFAVAGAAIVAAIAGDNTSYLIGRRYGRAFIVGYGARVGITDERFQRVEDVSAKYGAYIVVFARFLVPFRQLNGLVAGSTEMPWLKFFPASVLGGSLWVSIWMTIGYVFGRDMSLIPDVLHHISHGAAIAVLLLLAAVLYFGHRSLRHHWASSE